MQPQQQQGAVIVHQQPAVVAVAPVSNTNERYAHKQSTVLGIVLIVAGALSIIFNIIDLAVGTNGRTYYNILTYINQLSVYSNGISGYGFWCGIPYIVSGALGVAAGRTKLRGLIIGFLVMTIITAIGGGIQLIIGAAGAASTREIYPTVQRVVFDADDNCEGEMCDKWRTVYAMAILLCLLGLLAMAASIWGSILCCASGGCCNAGPATSGYVVGPAGPQVTVVNSQQQAGMQPQPMVVAPGYQQPPAYVAGYPSQQQPQVAAYPPPAAQPAAYYPPPQQPQQSGYPPQQKF